MKELHILLDFENVHPTLEALAKLAPGFTDVWLFHGPHQVKQAQSIAAGNERVTLVPRSGQGSNALDFHLSFYLGYVAAKHPDAELVVVANDRGYDPILAHARLLKFKARRVGYKAPVAKKAAVVKPASPVPVPVAAKKAVAKQASPKAAAPAKVVAAKKVTAIKKVQPAKKAVAKKVVAPKPTKAAQPAKPPKPPKPPKSAPASQITPDAKTLARIQKGFIKMGTKAPTKLKPFLRHVSALLGKGSTAELIDAMVAKLEAVGSVWFIGDEVVYGRK